MRMQTTIFYLVWGQNAHFIFHKQSPQESDVERIDFFFPLGFSCSTQGERLGKYHVFYILPLISLADVRHFAFNQSNCFLQ